MTFFVYSYLATANLIFINSFAEWNKEKKNKIYCLLCTLTNVQPLNCISFSSWHCVFSISMKAMSMVFRNGIFFYSFRIIFYSFRRFQFFFFNICFTVLCSVLHNHIVCIIKNPTTNTHIIHIMCAEGNFMSEIFNGKAVERAFDIG